MKQLLLIFALFILHSLFAYAGLNEGISAYERGDYPTAYQEFVQQAKGGDSTAQYNLGLMYEYGLGVEKDQVQAVIWYTASAEGGDPDAQLVIGDLLAEGYWGEADFEQAALWYQLAAEQNLAEAQRKLGKLYVQGTGVVRDQDKAAFWLGAAVEEGDREAGIWLAKLKPTRRKNASTSVAVPFIGPLTADRCRNGFPELTFDVNVRFEFEPARLHRNRSITELGQTLVHAESSRVLGLTESQIGVQTEIEYRLAKIKDAHCFWVHRIDAVLRPSAMDVYIAKEYKKGSCPYNVILQHEQEHVRVSRDTLKSYTTRVQSALTSPLIPTALNPEISNSPEAAKERMEKIVQQLIQPVVAALERENRSKQAQLDTVAEYERLRSRCSRW